MSSLNRLSRRELSPPVGSSRRAALERLEPRVLLDGGPQAQAIEVFAASPAVFVQNAGQWADPAVRYLFHGNGGSVLHTDAGPVLQLSRPPGQGREDQPDNHRLAVHFDDARAVGPVGLDRSGASFNFYLGQQSTWRTDVPGYETVAYPGLYEGIDLYTRGQANGLKYEFRVAAGGDYSKIRLSYEGITALAVDGTGALHVQTPLGELVDDAPYIYQQIGARTVRVPGCFRLLDAETYGFSIRGPYDPARELVIDPSITWSSYLGGGDDDGPSAFALDGAGNMYVSGQTQSADFPASGSFDEEYNGGGDAYVAKVTLAGDLLWSTFLGGSGTDGGAAQIDPADNVMLIGTTNSDDFPTTIGVFDRTYNGGTDAFLASINGAGKLYWSSYLGGSGDDFCTQLDFDSGGELLLSGSTTSGDFPTTAGAFDRTYHGGARGDAFLCRMTPYAGMLWSTFLGGSGSEAPSAMKVDGSDNVWLIGSTDSGDFPTSVGAYDDSHNGGDDMFAAKMSTTGFMWWSTYVGGSADDKATDFFFDTSNNAIVSGYTTSDDFPAFDSFDTTYHGGTDTVVAKMDPWGRVVWAGYLGGSGEDVGACYGFDLVGNLLITGRTTSADFPTTAGAFDPSYNGGTLYGDLFVTKVDCLGEQVVHSTYLGGSEDDLASAFAVDADGCIFLGGTTLSPDFPMVDAIDDSYNGGTVAGDVVLAVMDRTGELLWSSYLGGSADDGAGCFVLDGLNNVRVGGWTLSPDFPVVDAFDGTYDGGAASGDAFVMKIDMAGTGAEPKPDLVVSATTPADLTADPNQQLSIDVTTANSGDADATAGFTTALYVNDTTDFSGVGEQDKVAERQYAGMAESAGSTDSYAFSAPSTPGTYYLRAMADSGQAVGESAETNNWGQVVTLVVQGGPVQQPDLVIAHTTPADVTVEAGGNVNILITTANSGEADAAEPFHTTLYINDTDDFSGVGAQDEVAEYQYAGMASGTNFGRIYTFASPATPGTYYLCAMTDSDNAVGESDDDNNWGQQVVTLVVQGAVAEQPDLTVVNTTPTNVTVDPGGNVNIQVSTANSGAGAAGGTFTTALYLNDTDDFSGVGEQDKIAERDYAGMSAGSNATDMYNFAAPATPGTYYLRAMADSGQTVEESDEDNNWGQQTVTLVVQGGPGDLPDLLVVHTTPTQVTVDPEGAVNIQVSTANAGDSPAGSAFFTSLYLNDLNDFSSVGDEDKVAEHPYASMGAGANATHMYNFDAPAIPGAYYLCAMADSGLSVEESDEDNNWGQQVITLTVTGPVPQPDLVVYGTTPLQFTAVPGEELTVELTTANTGAGAAAEAFDTTLFLNDVDDFGSVGEQDAVAGREFAGMSAGDSSTDNYTFEAPAAPGTYYLRAIADEDDVVGESNEQNNWGQSVTLTVVEPGDVSRAEVFRCLDYNAAGAADDVREYGLAVRGGGLTGLAVTTPWGETFDAADLLPPAWAGEDWCGGTETMHLCAGTEADQRWFEVEWEDLSQTQWDQLDTAQTQVTVSYFGGSWSGSLDFAAVTQPADVPALTDPADGQTGVPLEPTIRWEPWGAPTPQGQIRLELDVQDNGDGYEVDLPADATSWTATAPLEDETTYDCELSFADRGTVLVNGVSVDVLAQAESDAAFTTALVMNFGGKTKAEFRDESRDAVTVSLKGPGTGVVYASGDGNDATQIVLEGTTDRSKLTIKTKGKGARTSVVDIIVHGSLKQLNAKTTDLLGDMEIEGGVGKLVLGDVAEDHTISIGESGVPAKMTFGCLADTSLISLTPIKSFKAVEWLDTDGTPDRLEAPWVGKLAIKGDKKTGAAGDFQADLVLDGAGATKSALGSAKIAGDLAGANWDIAADMGKLTVGGTVSDSTIRAGGNMAGITLGAADHADFLAGISQAVVRHAAAHDAFEQPAAIKSFKIKGLKPLPGEDPPRWFFCDSNVSAAQIGSVKLLNVEFENEDDPFGFWACDGGAENPIKSVKWSDKVDKDVKGKWSPKDPEPPPPDLVIEIL